MQEFIDESCRCCIVSRCDNNAQGSNSKLLCMEAKVATLASIQRLDNNQVQNKQHFWFMTCMTDVHQMDATAAVMHAIGLTCETWLRRASALSLWWAAWLQRHETNVLCDSLP